MTVGILYPGDMGSAVARLLVAHGGNVVSCVASRSNRTRTAAAVAGITCLATLGDVVQQADVVLSLVPQANVVETAIAFADAVRLTGCHPLYVDANSVSPTTMVEVTAAVTETYVTCVDAAFVGNAAALGDEKTTMYLSGPLAAVRTVMETVGGAFRVRALDTAIGTASALKLAQFGFNKGLVALFLEMMGAASRIGQSETLLASLRTFYPGTVETVERLLPTYPRHAARRVRELDEVVAWLSEVGEAGAMAAAARDVLAAFAALGLNPDVAWDASDVSREFCCRGAGRNDIGAPCG